MGLIINNFYSSKKKWNFRSPAKIDEGETKSLEKVIGSDKTFSIIMSQISQKKNNNIAISTAEETNTKVSEENRKGAENFREMGDKV